MDNEQDVFLMQFPVALAEERGFDLTTLATAAAIWAERSKCIMSTFDYEGIVDHAQKGRVHTWSALIDREPDRTLVYANGKPVYPH